MATRPTSDGFQAYWYWKSDGNEQSSNSEEWVPYSVVESDIIERALWNNDTTQRVELDNYWISLKDFVQISKYNDNERRQIKRIVSDRNDSKSALRDPLLLMPRLKPFDDSGLDGGLAFIYSWKKKNATLSNGEILKRAADGIIAEGVQLRK